jgi:hypothetical protein
MSIQNKIDSDQIGSIVNVNATDHGGGTMYYFSKSI